MNEQIIVEAHDQEVYVPVKVVFVTCFLLETDVTPVETLVLIQEEFINFLTKNGIEYTGPRERSMNSNGFDYSYPSYSIILDQSSYPLLEEYRDSHPEVTGFVTESYFAEEDKNDLSQRVYNKAKNVATGLAENKGLTILENPIIEEITLTNNNWTLQPPLRVRINHFRQLLKVQYKYQFSTKNNSNILF